MEMSALLKIEFSGGGGQFINHFSGGRFNSVSLPSGGTVNDSDIAIASLLKPYFQVIEKSEYGGNFTYLEREMFMPNVDPAPSNPLTVPPPDHILMGAFMSSSTNASHGDNVSLYCLTESILRDAVLREYGSFGDAEPEVASLMASLLNRIAASPLDDLPQIMNDFYAAVGVPESQRPIMKVIKNPTLTITRSNLADFAMVNDNINYRDVVIPAFFDAFDLVKERVTRQESYLNGIGYAPAVYTNNGGDGSNDTIVFTGAYAITNSFPEPVLAPPLG